MTGPVIPPEPGERFPSGVDVIDQGKCPRGALTPMACMFCMYGHMTECHWPWTCDEAECSHWAEIIEAELGYQPDPYEEE